MSLKKSIGFFLFSGVIVLTHARLLNPFTLMFGKSDRKLLTTTKKPRIEHSELIISGSTEFFTHNWKKRKSTSSENDNSIEKECELEIINDLDNPILLCWIGEDGKLHHFHPIFDNSIKDNSVCNNHLEYTEVGHAFICLKQTKTLPKYMRDVHDDMFICCFTPKNAKEKSTITLSKEQKRRRMFLRGSKHEISVTITKQPLTHNSDVIIDNTNKPYLSKLIAGFTVHYEHDVFTSVPHLEETILADFTAVVKLLPQQACVRLQATTPLWINKSITYGTVNNPVVGENVICVHCVSM